MKKEYHLAFEHYGSSTNHIFLFTKFLLNFYSDFPNDFNKLFADYLEVAKKYADETFKKMMKLNKNDLKKFDSIEQMVYNKKSELKIKEIEQYPSFVRELGDLLYQVKYSPNVITGLVEPLRILEFEWHIRAQEIVLAYAYFEAFLTKTIEIICKVSNSIIKKYLELDNQNIELSNEDVFAKYLDKLYKKIGSKSIKKRYKFLNEVCNLDIKIDSNRINGIFFFEQYRHLIVHNNGIIDKKYLRNMKKLGFSEERKKGLGKKLKLTSEYSLAHRHITRMFAIELYSKVCKKYL